MPAMPPIAFAGGGPSGLSIHATRSFIVLPGGEAHELDLVRLRSLVHDLDRVLARPSACRDIVNA